MKASIQARLENVCERHEEIAALLGEPDTINNQDKFVELSKEYSQLEPVVSAFKDYQSTSENLVNAREMEKDSDPEMREMAAEELPELQEKLATIESNLQVLLLPRDPRDEYNAFLEIRAGTGGDEAAIFAGDLLRMYLRFAEIKGWRSEIITERTGDHGGYKEVVCRLTGNSVFSQLKFESGAHRVQRVPETESQGRVHTSAATVAILPEADKVEEIDINPADLKTDTFRASGAGGQHVNKTESAVRVRHLPSGVVVECQQERSQLLNREKAMKMLKSRLYELEVRKRNEAKAEVEGSKRKIEWGSQVRNYVLHPYKLVKDLRTGHETGNTQAVLDGELNDFIKSLLLLEAGT